MKKLLLILLVVALAAFLLVGCIPSTPSEGEGEGEGEVEICPTVAVTSQATVAGKTYIKGGSQTITVTFAVPTAPVSVYVGPSIAKSLPVGVPETAAEVIMHTTDNKVYTGTSTFTGDCDEDYIYVLTCDACAPCKYPYIVDTDKPFIGEVEICAEDCVCEGVSLSFTGKKTEDCDPCDPKVYCGDCCSGFASWTIGIYNKMPFDACCDTPCYEPIDSGSGDCQIDWTSSVCLTATAGTDPKTRTVYALITALDNVGNKTKWLVEITIKYKEDGTLDCILYGPLVVYDKDGKPCVDTPDFSLCDDVICG